MRDKLDRHRLTKLTISPGSDARPLVITIITDRPTDQRLGAGQLATADTRTVPLLQF